MIPVSALKLYQYQHWNYTSISIETIPVSALKLYQFQHWNYTSISIETLPVSVSFLDKFCFNFSVSNTNDNRVNYEEILYLGDLQQQQIV